MNSKNRMLVFFALIVAMLSFACLGGAAATSVPEQVTPQVEIEQPTAEVSQPEQEGELVITSVNSYVDSFGDYNVAGEILNNTNETLENISLSVSITDANGDTLLKDSDDQPADSVEVQPYIGTLVPGAVAPFNYYISADDVTPADFDVTIKSYDESSAADLANFDIASVNLSETENGDIVITGEVVNLSSEHVDVESMAGAVLDDAKEVLAANFTLTYSRYLYPAGDPEGRDRGPFIVRLYGPIEGLAHWKIYARGVENSNTPSTDVDVQMSNAYVDAYGTYHLLGTLTNNGSSQISPSVLGSIYSPEKTVFDVASLNVPLYVNAGESVPFDINSFQVIGYIPSDQAAAAEKIIQPDLYWTFQTDHEVVSLEAGNVKVTRDGSDWTVTGTVVNTSDRKLSNINTVVQFLDENGQVLATNFITLYPPDGSETIDPGTSSEFSVSIYGQEDWDLASPDYQIILQGVVSD